MHIIRRLLTVFAFVAVLLPSAGLLALLSPTEQYETDALLHQALQRAKTTYQRRAGLQSAETKGKQTIDVQTQKLAVIAIKQRSLRDEMLSLRATIALIQSRSPFSIQSAKDALTFIEEEKNLLTSSIRALYVEGLTDEDPRFLVARSLHDHAMLPTVRLASLTASHMNVLKDLVLVAGAYGRLATLSAERDTLLASRAKLETEMARAQQTVEHSTDEIGEVRAMVDDVHTQVLKLQGELARIDARLRAKAERALLEKGLIDPLKPGEKRPAPIRPLFTWPVFGQLTAGFHDAAYLSYFGVPHEAQDIAVPQGTPVHSSADGVVFIVRDGGEKGYTYVLVGHRNGYATVYGHLSVVSVVSGQEVTAGQVIGLSGGARNERGSGPRTTNPHLHFEVIQGGVNIDPKTVLP